MDSHELMRLLIPDNNVKSIAEFTGLHRSLLYMERRPAGDKLTDTGTRNTIDRLDLFCEWNLSRNTELVRIVGERYLTMHRHHVHPVLGPVSVNDLLAQLGSASRECGQAVAVIAGRESLKECTVEVGQAKAALEHALILLSALEEQD